MLALVNLANPVVIAVIIGWTLSVTLHEFSHGIVAYWGGDYTIRQRGGLTLNPFQYVDPIISIVYPLVVFLLGGVPLSGGATYVRTDLLRNGWWSAAVSLAGPAMNFLLFVLLVIPFQPSIGWIRPQGDFSNWSTGQQFLAAMASLQFVAVCLNLLPIPPLDGFQAISPLLDPQTRSRLMSPAVAQAGFFIVFILMGFVRPVQEAFVTLEIGTLRHLGFSDLQAENIYNALPRALYGK